MLCQLHEQQGHHARQGGTCNLVPAPVPGVSEEFLVGVAQVRHFQSLAFQASPRTSRTRTPTPASLGQPLAPAQCSRSSAVPLCWQGGTVSAWWTRVRSRLGTWKPLASSPSIRFKSPPIVPMKSDWPQHLNQLMIQDASSEFNVGVVSSACSTVVAWECAESTVPE